MEESNLEPAFETRTISPQATAGGPVYAEATVTEPVTHQQTMQAVKHTTYLVEGTLGLTQFSSRKRYSDFEWLRAILPTQLPGIMLPALPMKQRNQRFEDSFVEERRQGLEQFLRALLMREGIVRSCHVVARFLAIADQEQLEQLKKEVSNRSLMDTCGEYTVIFANQLGSCQPPSDDAKFAEAKDFLQCHKVQLQDSINAVTRLCQHHRDVTAATSTVHAKLTAMHDEEISLSFPSGAERERMIAVLGKDSGICSEAPKAHYEVLLASLETELASARALDEAIESIGIVQKRLQAVQKRIEATRAEKQRLVNNPVMEDFVDARRDSDVTEPGDLASRQRKRDKILNAFDKLKSRDPAQQLENVRTRLEEELQEANFGEELVRMARTVCAWFELPSYVKDKLSGIRESYEQVIDSKADTATRVSDVYRTAIRERSQA